MSNVTNAEVLAVLHVIGGENGMTITEVAEALGFDAKKDGRALKFARKRQPVSQPA